MQEVAFILTEESLPSLPEAMKNALRQEHILEVVPPHREENNQIYMNVSRPKLCSLTTKACIEYGLLRFVIEQDIKYQTETTKHVADGIDSITCCDTVDGKLVYSEAKYAVLNKLSTKKYDELFVYNLKMFDSIRTKSYKLYKAFFGSDTRKDDWKLDLDWPSSYSHGSQKYMVLPVCSSTEDHTENVSSVRVFSNTHPNDNRYELLDAAIERLKLPTSYTAPHHSSDRYNNDTQQDPLAKTKTDNQPTPGFKRSYKLSAIVCSYVKDSCGFFSVRVSTMSSKGVKLPVGSKSDVSSTTDVWCVVLLGVTKAAKANIGKALVRQKSYTREDADKWYKSIDM